jgi:hypothetical protein
MGYDIIPGFFSSFTYLLSASLSIQKGMNNEPETSITLTVLVLSFGRSDI